MDEGGIEQVGWQIQFDGREGFERWETVETRIEVDQPRHGGHRDLLAVAEAHIAKATSRED